MLCVSCYLSSARVRPVPRISLDENGAVMAVSVLGLLAWCSVALNQLHGAGWGWTEADPSMGTAVAAGATSCSTGLGMLGSLLFTPRSSLFPSLGSRLLTKK